MSEEQMEMVAESPFYQNNETWDYVNSEEEIDALLSKYTN